MLEILTSSTSPLIVRTLYIISTICITDPRQVVTASSDSTREEDGVVGLTTMISLTNTWLINYKLGDNFTLPCVIQALQTDQYIQFVRLLNDQDYIISNGTRLTDDVTSTGRYSVTIHKYDNRTTVATLHITDLGSVDGGRLGCKVGPDIYGMTAYTGREVTVYVPVYSVKIFSLTQNSSYRLVPDGGTLTLLNTHHHVKSGVACQAVVKGGSIQPNVEIRLDGDDITSRFQKETLRNWGHKDDMTERGYKMTLSQETSHPETHHDGMLLECKVKVPLYPERKASVRLNVTYPAAFTCMDLVYAWTWHRDVRLSCNVSMNPAPILSNWWWRDQVTRSEVTMAAQSRREELIAVTRVMHGNFYQYSLLFSNLYDQLFRSYHLEIDNGMGLRQHTVTLIQGCVSLPRPKTSSDAPSSSPKHTTEICLLILLEMIITSFIVAGIDCNYRSSQG